MVFGVAQNWPSKRSACTYSLFQKIAELVVDIFILAKKYKEAKKKETTFKEKKKTYNLLLQQLTPELEEELKGKESYDTIETDQDRVDLEKLTHSIWHIQDDEKQDAMVVMETNKQFYLTYHRPYQFNTDYPEAFK